VSKKTRTTNDLSPDERRLVELYRRLPSPDIQGAYLRLFEAADRFGVEHLNVPKAGAAR
jgi:hypothetical protein